jgi:hypothetical protein
MGILTRRRFLVQTSVGTGIAVGSLAAFPHTLAAPAASPRPAADPTPLASLADVSLAGVSLAEPMIVHVRDAATAEIAVLIGTQEFVYRDPQLVARLVQTARQATEREA